MVEFTCYIGSNALSTYNARLTDGAVDALFKPAPMKKYVTNENAAMNGQKVLASYHKVDSRTFNLPIAITSTTHSDYISKLNSLLTALQSSAEVELKLQEGSGQGAVVHRFWVSYVDVQTYVHWNGRWGKIILRLTENNPADRAARS